VSIVAIFLDTSLFLYISRLKMNKSKDTIVMINTFRDWNLHSASEKVKDGNGMESRNAPDNKISQILGLNFFFQVRFPYTL
jgi:hypothetical protein